MDVCPKIYFASRKEAQMAAKLASNRGAKHLHAYCCTRCDGWHLTSQVSRCQRIKAWRAAQRQAARTAAKGPP